jgi:CBS domain-containing protein
MADDPLSHRMTVGDVMTRTVITAAPDTPIKAIAQLMIQHRVSGIPIVDPGGRVVGMVTEADLLLGKEAASNPRLESVLAPLRERREQAKARAETAAQAMSSPAVTTTADRPLGAAAREMRKHGVKRLPVVDDAQHVIGILSRHDILSALARPDPEIEREVRDLVLRRWLGVAPSGLEVEVDDGIVSLRGVVERRSEAEMVAYLVLGLDGVVAVRSGLSFRWDDADVKPTPEQRLQ